MTVEQLEATLNSIIEAVKGFRRLDQEKLADSLIAPDLREADMTLHELLDVAEQADDD